MMTATFPPQARSFLARRENRLRHYLWHSFRNYWLQLTPEDQATALKLCPGWQPPRPARDRNKQPIHDNRSGEDFLYMHRTMIMCVNSICAFVGSVNYPWVQGWDKVPAPGDPIYPVPPVPEGIPAADRAVYERVKSDAFYHDVLHPWEKQYTDPDWLRSVTLGELGSHLEFTIHNQLHNRWSTTSPLGYREGSFLEPVAATWDDPAYDFLGDEYSSHVNPVFWRLHGWVDNRIDDWKRANGITGDIPWQGTWCGPMGPMGHDEQGDHGHGHHGHGQPARMVAAAAMPGESDLSMPPVEMPMSAMFWMAPAGAEELRQLDAAAAFIYARAGCTGYFSQR